MCVTERANNEERRRRAAANLPQATGRGAQQPHLGNQNESLVNIPPPPRAHLPQVHAILAAPPSQGAEQPQLVNQNGSVNTARPPSPPPRGSPQSQRGDITQPRQHPTPNALLIPRQTMLDSQDSNEARGSQPRVYSRATTSFNPIPNPIPQSSGRGQLNSRQPRSSHSDVQKVNCILDFTGEVLKNAADGSRSGYKLESCLPDLACPVLGSP